MSQNAPSNNKALEKVNPLNMNLDLFSNKSSMETLINIAKKQKQSIMKKPNDNPIEDKGQGKYSSVTFEPNTKTNTRVLLNDEEIAPITEIKYQRAERKGQMFNSTKLNGKLDIMKRLNNNVVANTKSSSNIINKEETINSTKEEPQNNKENQEEEQEMAPTFVGRADYRTSSFVPPPKEYRDIKKSLFQSVGGGGGSSGFKPDRHEIITDKQYYTCRKAISVLEYSYREDQNIAYKESMEDKGKSIDCLGNNPNEGLFCLFDGHGGDFVSKYLQAHYPSYFKKVQYEDSENIDHILKTSFKNIDKELQSLDLVSVGSTGCVIYIRRENDHQIVYTANVGDTRCSLISPIKWKQLTYEHRANDPSEKARIINSGGSIINERVNGMLMLSRAFGDFELKSFGVKVEPYICKINIDSNQKNQFLICASDGVWDVLTEEDIQTYIMFNNDTEELCRTIIKNTLAKGSWDNISCFAIKLT